MRKRNYREFWRAFSLALFPASLLAIWLGSYPEVPVEARNVAVGLFGGAFGVAAAIWLHRRLSRGSRGRRPR